MMASADLDRYGAYAEPATLTIRRLLPGPIERVWSYLTDSDLRKQWLAAGEMQLRPGAPFEFVWRNAELAGSQGDRPEGMPEEHRLAAEITECEPPFRLGFTWGRSGGVTITLAPEGDQVLLTLEHRRLPDRGTAVNVSAGWHAHLDVMAAVLEGNRPAVFWTHWQSLRDEYEGRLPR